MRIKALPALAAFAVFLALPPVSAFAEAYSPAQFARELRERVGAKRNAGASTATAVFLRTALKDPRNKKFAVQYIARANTVLRPRLAASFQARSRVTLVRAVNIGYFTRLRYNARDSRYVATLRRLITTLPSSRRTITVARQLSGLVTAFARARGGSVDDINFLTGVIYGAAGQTPPPPVS